ncbi:hypothetical protein [Dipodfec virus UOA04_Rod_751]|nr:hypothetical protein [Dipodfec virus UOA04_Rod_751]
MSFRYAVDLFDYVEERKKYDVQEDLIDARFRF